MLKLIYYGNPKLRQKANPVQHFDDELAGFCKELCKTMIFHNGVGLAATQVADMRRVFALDMSFDIQSDNKALPAPKIFINPSIVEKSQETFSLTDGCLSIPGVYFHNSRPKRIKVKYQDIQGKFFEDSLENELAFAFQHELDHLDGILYIDHLPEEEKMQALQQIQELKNQYS